jgi:hypothetical protein
MLNFFISEPRTLFSKKYRERISIAVAGAMNSLAWIPEKAANVVSIFCYVLQACIDPYCWTFLKSPLKFETDKI